MSFKEANWTEGVVLLVPLVGIVVLLIASYFFALFLGPTLFFSTSEGLESSGRFLSGLPIQLFGVFDFYVPVQFTWGAFFLFLSSFYLVCFVISLGWRKDFYHVVRRVFSRSVGSLFDNWLFTMVVVASMLLVAFVLITAFQDVVGVETGVPSLPENRFEAYLSLAYAPLIEEISFRISPIGLFLIVYLFSVGANSVAAMSLWQRVKLFFGAFLYPEKAKEMVGFKTVGANGFRNGISIGEWVMVLVTSVIFGLMHFVSGTGWGPGKITTASMNGFVFGLVYLAYGFQAPILLHWFLNYYSYTYVLAAEFYPSVYSLFVVIDLATLFLGLSALFGLAVWILTGRRKAVSATKSSVVDASL